MKRYRIAAALLAVCLLACLLTGCTEKKPAQETQAAPTLPSL